MMRPQTKGKYLSAINQLIAEKREIPLEKFNEISRKHFGNFVTMHYFRKAGLLEEVSPRVYNINPSIPPNVILNSYEKYQHDVGLKAAKKHKLLKKIEKEMSQSGVKREYRKEFGELQNGKNISTPTISVARKLLDGNSYHTDKALEMVKQLRDWGYDVTCKKSIEL